MKELKIENKILKSFFKIKLKTKIMSNNAQNWGETERSNLWASELQIYRS